jgi:D-xylose transport system permease protein
MLETIQRVFGKNIRSSILVLALILIWIGFAFAVPGFAYVSPDHIQNVFTQMAIIAIMACGMVFVIVTGGIDLSVGFGAGFVSVFAAALLYHKIIEAPLHAMMPGLSPHVLEIVTAVLIVVLSMLAGLLIGLFQGAIIAYLSVPPFIVTLGGMFIFKSGILLITQGKSLFISSNDTYKFLAQGLISPLAGLVLSTLVSIALFAMVFRNRAKKRQYGIEPGSLGMDLAKAGAAVTLLIGYVLIVNRTFDPTASPSVKGVPFLVLVLACIAILMSYISKNTRFGRYAYAIGGNREAARLSGINIKRSIFSIYVTMGLLVGVSGIALAAYVGSGTTGAGGGYELDVIASCILGGTSTLGGEGTVFGAIIGALIMQSLSNGLQMMNVNSNVQYLIKGLVLILAVWADISMKKRKS